ncbi:hypothetical protein FRC07_006641 [Ceratobasidium sp. 392]|nr:hypothetical protein FRC07_006641 [Ceratobasidium sp. 392]
MVGVSPSGQALPLQAVYAGKTARSLPENNAPYMDAAYDRSFHFDFSGNTSYWANQCTMRSWVTNILVPYFLQAIEKSHLPRTQRCILQIDIWAVHRSAEFRSWMAKTYPWIVIHYVPGGCTGQFQACDLLVNRALKIAIQQACHADIVEETTNALRSGVSPRDVCLDTTLKTLRNRSVRWMVLAHNAINNTELIQKAFFLCAVPGTNLNLSHASLTSHEARQALLNLRSSDPAFYGEITLGRSTTADDNLEMETELEDGPVDDNGELDITMQEFQTLAVAANSAAEVAELGKILLQEDAVATMDSNNAGGKRLRSGRQL